MTKQPEKNQPHHASQPDHLLANGLLDGVLSQAQTAATEFLASEQAQQMSEISQEWAAEATKFIRKNPWAAVLGAAAIGYYLGSTRNRGGGSR